MADDPEITLAELRRRIKAEGLPKLSAEALRAAKLTRGYRIVADRNEDGLKLSEEARRLFHQKSDPQWLWRKR